MNLILPAFRARNSVPLSGARSLICISATRTLHRDSGKKNKDPSQLFRSRRRSSSVAFSSPPQCQIYVSESTNPYFNLTFEDWLFRHAPTEKPLLLVYRNTPCVVIGRNQNPWKEINLQALRSQSSTDSLPPGRHLIPFIRRRSGGGTVYHDLGNTNYSIHLPRASFNRHGTAQIVARAIRSLGIEAHINERNDICVGSWKVSGSAYRITNKRAYHHGTMLLSTDLAVLGDVLKPTNKDDMLTKGVASVPSPVCNLRQFDTSIAHEVFIDAIVREFRLEYGVCDNASYCVVSGDEEALAGIEYIRKGMVELPSWEWSYGQTPEFTYTVRHSFAWGDVTAKIYSKHGVILSCTLRIDNTGLPTADLERLVRFSKSLENKRYDPDEIANIIGSDGLTKDVGTWLQRVVAT